MDSTVVMGIAALALAAGLVIGWLASRWSGTKGIRQRRLTQQLDQIQTEHTRYQAEVNQHFLETAELIRRLNDSYRDVHDHLARSASKLCSEGDIRYELEQARNGSRLTHEIPSDETLEPPRDYAPKNHDLDKGTLSEEYGLEREDQEREASSQKH